MNKKPPILILLAIILSACSLTRQTILKNPTSGADLPLSTEAASAPDRTPAANQSAPLPTQTLADTIKNQATNQPAATDQPAATREPEIPTPAQVSGTAVVSASVLNLRMGPGYGYGVIRMLPEGQTVKVLGRSVNGDWIEVMVDEQTGGWVYGRYLETSFDLAAFPVKGAYGGPYNQSGPPASASTFSLYMSINGRQATINLGRFPADTPIEALLGRPGESANLLVASGQTNANGAAQLDFSLPEAWQNGALLSEQELLLVVRSVDGSFSQSATIQYIH
jgi:hypothetical protein